MVDAPGDSRIKRWVTLNGLSTHYEMVYNEAAMIVLLHEIGGSLESWDSIVPTLSERFGTLRYDQRGCGLSEKVRAPFRFEDLVEDLKQLLLALQVPLPCYLVGSAAGAAIALLFAASNPQWVGKLVLCSPAAEVSVQRSAYLQERAALAESAGMRATLPLSLANSYPQNVVHNQAAYETYKARFLAQDPTCYGLMNRALMAMDTTDALKRIHCPTLVLAGEHDQVRPPDEVAELASRIPGAQFEQLDGGHLLSQQAPQELLIALSAFLA